MAGRNFYRYVFNKPRVVERTETYTLKANDDGYFLDAFGGSVSTTLPRWGEAFASTLSLFLSFPSVTIPQGRTVSSATLNITVSGETGTAPDDMVVFAEDIGAASQPSVSNNPNTWTQTTAKSAAQNYPTTGAKQIDVTAVVQEIVNRGDWKGGNRINFGAIGDTTTAGDNNYYSFTNNISTLVVTFT